MVAGPHGDHLVVTRGPDHFQQQFRPGAVHVSLHVKFIVQPAPAGQRIPVPDSAPVPESS